ncbi:hypothetical protein V5799_029751 [Amblyomma americanum]|uniref:Peptidase M13 N-terminal domain-containing protein n=1 Tax=Amblyomma americanum TaxID=6943 RepID=A0AAQ4EQ56_AMBAM
MDATTYSPKRRHNTRTQAGQHNDDGGEQPSASMAARTTRRTSTRTSPSLCDEPKTVPTTKLKTGTRHIKDKTGTVFAVSSAANPSSIKAIGATSAGADAPLLKGPGNTGAACGQPGADVVQVTTSLPLTSAPSCAEEEHPEEPGEPRSPPSKEDDLIQFTAATIKSPTRLEDTLAASVASGLPTVLNTQSRGSKIFVSRGPTYEQIDPSFFENIDIRRSPKTETTTSRKIVPRRIVGGAIMAIGLLITALAFAFLAFLMEHDKFCDTADCIHHASLLERIVNTAIDPCDDFSAYVCSGFLQAKFGEHIKSTIESLRYAWYEEFDYLLYYQSYYAAYTADSGVNETAVDEIRVLEHTVLSKLNSVSKSQSPTPSVFSFREVDRRVPNASTAYWLPRFDEGLQLQPRLAPDDEVILSDILLLQAFNSLLVIYGDDDMKALLAWQLVQLYSPLAETALMTARFGSKQKAEIFRPVYCAHHVEESFKVLVLSLATVSRITVKDRRLITTAFINLVSTALSKMNASRWMDNESKARVAQKLALVQMQMWPPESLLSDVLLEETYSDIPENASLFEYWATSRSATSQMNQTQDYRDALDLPGSNFPLYFAYDYLLNNVKIALGAATPPAYYHDGTAAMFYGGLGFLMALQIVRSIDDEGLKWASNKSIVNSILSESTARSYRTRQVCLELSGTKSLFPEIPALQTTFSAFKASRLHDGMERLPLSSDLPEDKVFFLTICLMTCVRKGSTEPLAVDCNKMVPSSEVFAHVYRCKKGTKMNPVKKCSFFGV